MHTKVGEGDYPLARKIRLRYAVTQPYYAPSYKHQKRTRNPKSKKKHTIVILPLTCQLYSFSTPISS
ncbi:hypothetical protein G7K_0495-t1 [Saitoella complicata NRRL Y-17804]|uniref:Uncharacterized protein n=1 Tax=Saitoella complicata (strain BCRC 22490 / CBS 7301 / JCM 7358 / NBRC 10748 / NRRL Y-17804) TaxID=698492 RepID=A0A0E9NA29_SAICN|nr:hypothetical protein G7K_0495-t1 [Saitoella complicata NRRL Y-17804]